MHRQTHDPHIHDKHTKTRTTFEILIAHVKSEILIEIINDFPLTVDSAESIQNSSEKKTTCNVTTR